MPPLRRLARRSPLAAAFTLVEVLIVVVILGVLAAMVIPQFANATGAAKRSAFATSLDQFTRAAMLMQQETGDYPPDGSSGEVPAGFEDYIQASRWTQATPIGGVWDAENSSLGYRSAIGVHFDGTGETRDDAFMTDIDLRLDDGVLTSGAFREIVDNQRYYSIVDSSAP